jgi:hypothetical protein
MNRATRFPKPFVFCVGMTKGGAGKTWWALNLASLLGLSGYRVGAVDLNPQHDLAADHGILMRRGIYPRFDVVAHEIIDANGLPQPLPDLSGFLACDFIIYDTPQFLNFPVVRSAWEQCHLMVFPFTEDGANLKNYVAAVKQYRALANDLAPIACVPNNVSALNNAAPLKELMEVLRLMEDLGCDVPRLSQQHMIDNNPLMRVQNTRWVYNDRTNSHERKEVKRKFLDNVLLSLEWLLLIAQKYYGPLPAKSLPEIAVTDPEGVRAALAAEHQARFGNQTVPAVA